ncbi:MAG TPA: hypothetical protein VN372_14455 [Methanospirillum sp.]|nr:hypothetical protein [Methanospirillum sp.]
MVELNDSTRRLIIFVTIVLGGSILLIFDIPVLYLMVAILALAGALMVITGMVILSELIQDIRIKLKNRKPRVKKPKPKKEGGAQSDGEGLFAGLMKKLPKMPSMPSVSLPRPKLPEKSSKPKREKEDKKTKQDSVPEEDKEERDSFGGSEQGSASASMDDDDLEEGFLDGLDLDDGLDIDAELESVNPEFDTVRTPYGDRNAMDDLPSADQVKKMDITTDSEEENVIIDDDRGSDEIDEIYSSTFDIGSDSGGEIISTMEGGDAISSSDLASYSSSEETPYMYGGGGGDDESGEEQFELSQGKGMGDDDLIASLKADISDLKKRDDDVLLRDLKDIHVTAQELAQELADIMKVITRKTKKK